LARTRQVLVLFAAIFFLFTTVSAADAAVSLTRPEAALLNVINAARAQHGLKALAPDPKLENAARAHSLDMAANGYFDHGNFAGRIFSFGVRAPRIGENLAWNGGRWVSAKRIVTAWLWSPEHRANLLHGGYRRIGIGTARGSYQGSAATMITADFAGR
jgi:uncharacterized protein YkwD